MSYYGIAARQVADLIKELNLYQEYSSDTQAYNHIGALYTNIVLQSGLNYKTVVQPRVSRVLINYPKANTVNGFIEVIEMEGIENIISWKHPDKINRIFDLLEFSKDNSINTYIDLIKFLGTESNQEKFLKLKGFGFKTLDYTLKLLNFDTIAVDRHIYSFIELAGLTVIDYRTTKRIVEFAADLLSVSRSSIDYSIWNFMSTKKRIKEKDQQLAIDFNNNILTV